ncbi:hypothetical protein OH492_13375 [Vibrio chagasii]|nr:hypothetical protein [Vibrio chagasii]
MILALRGSEYQNVANIYAGNVSWFNGDASEFAKPPHKDIAQLYVDMMGSPDAIKKGRGPHDRKTTVR